MKAEMYSLVRQITGEKEAELEASDVRTALEALRRRYGAEFEKRIYDGKTLSDGINILLRGKNIHVLQGLDTPLSDGDVISLFYSIEGG